MEIVLLQAKCAELESSEMTPSIRTILTLANKIYQENSKLMKRIQELERENNKQTEYSSSLKVNFPQAALNKVKAIKISLIAQLNETMFKLTKTRTAHDELQKVISALQTKRNSTSFHPSRQIIECSMIYIRSMRNLPRYYKAIRE